MVENSKIAWTDHTFNPWIGCARVSEGCANCYAEAWGERFGFKWGINAPRVLTKDSNWAQPLKWNKQAQEQGVRYRVFCASLADVFEDHPDISSVWRARLWATIERTPHLDWLLLTKRPRNIGKFLPPDWGAGWHNVWLGVTVENQDQANTRIPTLLNVHAEKRFLSMEPLLAPVNLSSIRESFESENGSYHEAVESCLNGRRFDIWSDGEIDGCPAIDWVIVGGESGPKARPFDVSACRDIVKQCKDAGVPVFVKQMGFRPFFGSAPYADNGRYGLKGERFDDWPVDLQVRQFPEVSHD